MILLSSSSWILFLEGPETISGWSLDPLIA